jgi:hypothetical protein
MLCEGPSAPFGFAFPSFATGPHSCGGASTASSEIGAQVFSVRRIPDLLKVQGIRDDTDHNGAVPPKIGEVVNLDVNNLLLGVFISLIGMALLMYGRKEVRVPHIVAGLVLIVYPYFVGSLLLELIVAVVVIGGLALASRVGI